jgi:ribosome-associated toxin RatA of RatAB toxin-antitoxin module
MGSHRLRWEVMPMDDEHLRNVWGFEKVGAVNCRMCLNIQMKFDKKAIKIFIANMNSDMAFV